MSRSAVGLGPACDVELFAFNAANQVFTAQVNKYPDTRNFKAIGEGGDDFVQSMASAVEQVLGPIQKDCIKQRTSKHANYVSVTIGPVRVDHSDQVSLVKLQGYLHYDIFSGVLL